MVVFMNDQPAFPAPAGVAHITEQGMTLRDYFAAKAMQAFISGWINLQIYPEADIYVAEHAYRMADAMLKARETTQGETHV